MRQALEGVSWVILINSGYDHEGAIPRYAGTDMSAAWDCLVDMIDEDCHYDYIEVEVRVSNQVFAFATLGIQKWHGRVPRVRWFVRDDEAGEYAYFPWPGALKRLKGEKR